MKQTFNILVFLLLCLPTFLFAQNDGQKEVCGTEFTPEMEARLLQNIETAKRLNLPLANRTTTYIAIKFHLVANNDGSNRVSKAKVLEALCALNENYAPQDVVFYLAGMYDMDNSNVNNHTNSTSAQFQMSVRKSQHNNAMNVFVCSAVNTNNATQGITLGYYTPQYDLIAIRQNQMNTTSTTLTHEAGHFLSLPHPFNGWEGVEYHTSNNPSGSAYGANNLPPTTMGGLNVERANGSNCSNSGDFFCDTEPDYNLGFLGGNNCNYTQGAVDPTGATINPDETLYMSYFNDNCQNQFTANQQSAIAADLLTFERNYIKGTPSTTVEITDQTVLASPSNGGTTPHYDAVYLNWNDVPNATQYFVQIARNSSFSLIVDEKLVTNSIYMSSALSSSTNYFWRVKAINPVSPCNGYSATQQFTTSSFTIDTEEQLGITDIKLQPNVTAAGQTISLSIQTEEKIDATIRIVNMAGQVMKNIDNVTFQAGTHIHEIQTAGLAPGVYIVNLQSDKGQVNQRLMITN